MPKFFLPFRADCTDYSVGDIIEISGADALHISKTLRMKVGEKVTVTDSKALDYFTTIDSFDSKSVYLKVESVEKSSVELNKRISLFQALIKNDKMDTVIQKAVELGVTDIYPVAAQRSVMKLDNSGESKKLERWNKIALEASKQCRRGVVPKVHSVKDMKECASLLGEHDIKFYCYELEEKNSIKDAIKDKDFNSLGFYIGPEGGISDSEKELFDKEGVLSVTLGKLILRTETAGMAVLSMLLYETRL